MRKAPHHWPDVATLIDNNYRNMHARDVKIERPQGGRRGECGFARCRISLVHMFGSVFGYGPRQCLEINKPIDLSHAGVCLPCRLLYSHLGERRHMLRRLGSTDAGDAEGGWSHALPGAKPILCRHFLQHLACDSSLLGPGQASRRARGPVPECFEIG